MSITPRSHPPQGARAPRYSPVSPTSPQMWMTAVDIVVDIRRFGVRSVSFVRLSPCVDALWIPTDHARGTASRRCVQVRSECGRSRGVKFPSPDAHIRDSRHPQRLPRRHMAYSPRKGTPSTLSPLPTTMTTDIDQLFTHRLRAAGGGYLPYCLSPTGQRAWRTPSGGRP